MSAAATIDEFLCGRLRLLQPQSGFRAGTDTVFLAASIPAKPGERVLELGAGAGVGLACLAARIEGLSLHGIEINAQSAALAEENLALLPAKEAVIWRGDCLSPPKELMQLSFDHVFMNPPYFAELAHSAPKDKGNAQARIDAQGLASWVALARKRLKPKGSLTIIQRAAMLDQILAALDGFGAIRVLPLTAQADAPAKTVIVQAYWQRKTPMRLLPPFLLRSPSGEESEEAKAIACAGQALEAFINP